MWEDARMRWLFLRFFFCLSNLALLPLHIREKNFEEFSKHLKGLVELYKLPGDKYVDVF